MATVRVSNKRLVIEWNLGHLSRDEIGALFARLIIEVPRIELLQITPQSGNGCTLWSRLPEEDDEFDALGRAESVIGLPPKGVTSRVETVHEPLELVSGLQEIALGASLDCGTLWQSALRISQDRHTIAKLRAKLRERLQRAQPVALSSTGESDDA